MKIDTIRLTRSSELKQMRLDRNVGKVQLSELSGLHLATIYRIESGLIGWNVDSEIIYIETLKKCNVIKNSI